MLSTSRTYADLLKEHVTAPCRFFQPFAAANMTWQGQDDALMLGMICHNLLRYRGELNDYQEITCSIPHYEITVRRNTLTIHCTQRQEDILQATYGSITRTMQVTHSGLRPVDLERFKHFIKTIYEVQMRAANLKHSHKSFSKDALNEMVQNHRSRRAQRQAANGVNVEVSPRPRSAMDTAGGRSPFPIYEPLAAQIADLSVDTADSELQRSLTRQPPRRAF